MKLLDYFFYVLVKWQIPILKKDLPDSKFSACLFLSLWIMWSFISFLCICGLLIQNQFLVFAVGSFWFHLAIATILVIWVYIRYFKRIPFDNIQRDRDAMKRVKRFFFYLLFIIFLIGIPILLFTTYRLYKFGQIKWW